MTNVLYDSLLIKISPFFVSFCLLFHSLASSSAVGEDWPTYRHDNYRSGVTIESITFPLQEVWRSSSFIPPQTAWSGPAKWDAYANIKELKSMRDFDPVFYTTVAGNQVFWGSSVDDSAHCADLQTGREQWIFCTNGPVRIPPTYDQQKVFLGSDDGYIYCLNAVNGQKIWSYKPSPDTTLIPHNGKFISPWPCRTGAFVQNGVVYFAASLLPWKESYLCALDSITGSDRGEGLFKIVHEKSTMQGPILASSTRLYLSHGRQQPQVYDLKTGQRIGEIGKSGDGGCFAILTTDDLFIHGEGQNHAGQGELRGFNAKSTDRLATFPQANCMVIQNDFVYFHSNGTLVALNRSKNIQYQSEKFELESTEERLRKQFKKMDDPKAENQETKDILHQIETIQNDIKQKQNQIRDTFIWKQHVSFYHSMILAGEYLILGGKNLIAAHTISNGELQWKQEIEGEVQGLTYANGHLLASTDRGLIVCFQNPND